MGHWIQVSTLNYLYRDASSRCKLISLSLLLSHVCVGREGACDECVRQAEIAERLESARPPPSPYRLTRREALDLLYMDVRPCESTIHQLNASLTLPQHAALLSFW